MPVGFSDPVRNQELPPKSIVGHYVHYGEVAQIIEQNSETHAEATSAPSLNTAARHDVSAPKVSGDGALPSPTDQDQTPAHLASLYDRARGYVEAASSANTRKAYAVTGSIFSPGAGEPIWLPSPRMRRRLASTSQPALLAVPLAPLHAAPRPTPFQPSNDASPPSAGTMPSVVSRSIARTGTSPR